ncbi:unnamed protein product [Ambrosiozyma monospora]|uniref:Unnamed protein product n=1 Tax=Ambrosiozyma monospora TaxID=43982 RepID=A0ACB5T837_AMBMO|nr:unnamed protein product [Ambrosiozyma monospora]
MRDSTEHPDSENKVPQHQQHHEGPEFQQQQGQFIPDVDQTDAKVAELYFNKVHNPPNRATGSDFLTAQIQAQQSHHQSMPMSIDGTTYSNSENGGSTSNDENNIVGGYKPIHEIFAPQIGGTKTMNEYLEEIQRSGLGDDLDIGRMGGVGAGVLGGAGINVGMGDVGSSGFAPGNEYMLGGGVNGGMNNFANSSMNAAFGPVGVGVSSAVNQVPFGVANTFNINGAGMGDGADTGFGSNGNSIGATERRNVGVEGGDMNSYLNFGIGLNTDDELDFSSADFAFN